MTSVSADLAAVERRIAELSRVSQSAGSQPAGGVKAFAAHTEAAVQALVRDAAKRAGVDPALLLAVASAESGFDPGAVSPAGAVGVMQLMPSTAKALGIANPYDPASNVRGGALYLHALLARFGGDVRLAVAAYNAGPAAVERYGGVPPYTQTRAYVERVLASYRASATR